jgi:hypothetical protein
MSMKEHRYITTIIFLALFGILGIICAGYVHAYSSYTSTFHGLSTSGYTSNYPSVMGFRTGTYAGGGYFHYSVQSGSRYMYDQRYRVINQRSMYNPYRTTYYRPPVQPRTVTRPTAYYPLRLSPVNSATYQRSYYRTDLPAQRLHDWRFAPRHYWDRGTWSFEGSW